MNKFEKKKHLNDQVKNLIYNSQYDMDNNLDKVLKKFIVLFL